MTVSSFITNLQARHRGMLSGRAFRASAEAIVPGGVDAELEKSYPYIFLEHLQAAIGKTEYQSLIGYVTFGAEELSASLLVKRCIVKEFAQLSQLSHYPQRSGWHELVDPFLAQNEPPTSLSIQEYLTIRSWVATPFATLPSFFDAQTGEPLGGSQMELIMALHYMVKEALRSVVED